jgi:glycerol-3-phosphate cytidylyltransferase
MTGKCLESKKYKIGYTQGVYDMFHIGHLNLINQAKTYCDYLIVGVNSDELVESYKHKKPVINQHDRMTIVSNIKAVDNCIIANTLDKVQAFNELHFDAVFIGDDWKGNQRWLQTEKDLAPHGVDVVYLPHTDGVSSTILRPQNGHKVEEW